eukprot:1795231-Rhodomonas_salina.1
MKQDYLHERRESPPIADKKDTGFQIVPPVAPSTLIPETEVVRGVCQRCNEPVTTAQQREKQNNNTYVHIVDSNGRCITEAANQPAAPGDSSVNRRVSLVILAPRTSPPVANLVPEPVEVRGNCPRCQEAVTTAQQREKQQNGTYVHLVDPSGRCITGTNTKPQTQPDQPAGVADRRMSFEMAAPIPNTVEIRGMCQRCSEPVTTAQQREKQPNGTYVHVVDVGGRCIKDSVAYNQAPGSPLATVFRPSSPMGAFRPSSPLGGVRPASPLASDVNRPAAPLGAVLRTDQGAVVTSLLSLSPSGYR